MGIRAVFFDVGETLVDETRHWGLWADYLGVPRFTFYAALGSVISEGRHHRDVFHIFNPDFDYHAAWQERVARGEVYEFLASDFYPDAIPCLRELKQLGYKIGIAGNQPEGCEAALRHAGVEADVLASSALWGVEKPSPRFFEHIIASAGMSAEAIAYVGDHVTNDIEPALQCGLAAIFIRRGPWALLRGSGAKVARAEIASLSQLPQVIASL